jgi:hypothetical protein
VASAGMQRSEWITGTYPTHVLPKSELKSSEYSLPSDDGSLGRQVESAAATLLAAQRIMSL